MKNFISIFIMAVTIISCNNKPIKSQKEILTLAKREGYKLKAKMNMVDVEY